MEQWSKIEKKIKEEFANRSLEPSEDLWAKIECRLDTMDATRKKSKYRRMIWMAASIVMLCGSSYYFLFSNSQVEILKNVDAFEEGNKEGVVEGSRIEKATIREEVIPNVVNGSVRKIVHSKSVVSEPVVSYEKASNSKELKLMISKPMEATMHPEKENLFDLDSVTATVLEESKGFEIDPNSLLREVESELKVEYRETVFGQIKRNFKEAKTNFANRNYE